eukprot:maker-scaffold217_size252476-snap-gene-1.30 protein:Tk00457 transcript:maker-scaffold217_size252476-snap-gene-1.30-mRNA-1 annotation:"hypothetical protein DAPPUDRAFT_301951"
MIFGRAIVLLILCCDWTSGQFEDLKNILPSMIKSLDRIDLIDPLHTLRDHLARNQTSKLTETSRVNYEWKVWQSDLVVDLLKDDPHGIMGHLLASMPNHVVEGITDEKDFVEIFLQYVVAPITPIFGVSPTCFRESLEYAKNLFQSPSDWAYEMLDSTGKTPDGILTDTKDLCEILHIWTSHPTLCDLIPEFWGTVVMPAGNTQGLGHYQGCVSVTTEEFLGRFCLVQLASSSNTDARMYQGYDTKPRMPTVPGWVGGILPDNWTDVELVSFYLDNTNIMWGQCIPSGCTSEDVLVNSFFIYDSLKSFAAPLTCETREKDAEMATLDNTGLGIAIMFGVLGGIIALCTVFDMIWIAYHSDSQHSGESHMGFKLAKSFSAATNCIKIFTINKSGGDNLACINGLRVISMVWIIFGHTYLNFSGGPSQRPKLVENVNFGKDSSMGYELVMNAFPAVDTFFFMSGLLVGYLSFLELQKGRFNIILFYVHRYIRLTIPLALVIAFEAGIVYSLGSGPIWWMNGYNPSKFCRKNWWTNLLYINSFVHQNEQCLGVTWYLACDMQMFILSPLIFWPMYKLKDSLQKALSYWMVFMLVFTIVPVSLMVAFELPPTHVILVLYDYDALSMDQDFYQRFYTRFQPYLIGILLGFVFFKTRGKEVAIAWYVSLGAWIASLACLFAVVFGTWSMRRDSTFFHPSYSPFVSVLYQGFGKVAWSLALGWITFACVKGYGGVVNSFLSWGFFVPLARLCYMVYLVHWDVLSLFTQTLTYTVDMVPITMLIYVTALTLIAFGIGLVGTLVVEAPFINLEKLLLKKILKSK